MCKVICVCNFKGGCGKSTSAANLGYGLAREGKKVLMIDTDSQRGLSICMGYHNTNDLDVTLHSVFRKMIDKGEVITEEGILHHEEGPDLMPASSLISVLESELLQMKNGEYLLGRYLEAVKKDYDYCIVDCNSNLGRMTISALIASDSVRVKKEQRYQKQIKQSLNPFRSNVIRSSIILTMILRTNTWKRCVLLRQLFGNEDRMDIDWFLKAEQSGFVLDYGECFHKMDLDKLSVQYSKKMLSVHYSEWILMGNLNSAVEVLINRCGIEEAEVLDAEAWILLKLSQINLSVFRDFYQLIARCYSKDVSDLYRENLKMIKKSCGKIVKRYGIDEVFDSVPEK